MKTTFRLMNRISHARSILDSAFRTLGLEPVTDEQAALLGTDYTATMAMLDDWQARCGLHPAFVSCVIDLITPMYTTPLFERAAARIVCVNRATFEN